jgi:hypothetical protein
VRRVINPGRRRTIGLTFLVLGLLLGGFALYSVLVREGGSPDGAFAAAVSCSCAGLLWLSLDRQRDG